MGEHGTYSIDPERSRPWVYVWKRHIGDEWANLQYCMRHYEEEGCNFNFFDASFHFEDLFSLIDAPSKFKTFNIPNLHGIKIKNSSSNNANYVRNAIKRAGKHKYSFTEINRSHIKHMWNKDKEAYKTDYFPTKKTWNSSSFNKNKICFSFEGGNENHTCGKWIRKKGFSKRPKDILRILDSFPSKKFVKIGLPLSLQDIVSELSTCSVMVSIDNGMAHIARSVGCPLILIQDEWDLERGFPSSVYSYTKAAGTDDAIKKLAKFL